jgi:hypothetical protein
MAAVSASTRHILTLTGRGFNYAQIGRVTGVNRSLIRQIAQGAKPGRNLTPTLRALVKSEAPAPKKGKSVENVKLPAPKRKALATGERAPVRQKEQQTSQIPVAGQKEKEGATVERRTAKAGTNAITRAAAKGQNVKISIRFKSVKNYASSKAAPGTVDLFDRGGMNAQQVLDMLEGFDGSDGKRFEQLVEEVLSARGVEVRGFEGIEVSRFDVDRR